MKEKKGEKKGRASILMDDMLRVPDERVNSFDLIEAISEESHQDDLIEEEEKMEGFLNLGLKSSLKQETKFGASPRNLKPALKQETKYGVSTRNPNGPTYTYSARKPSPGSKASARQKDSSR